MIKEADDIEKYLIKIVCSRKILALGFYIKDMIYYANTYMIIEKSYNTMQQQKCWSKDGRTEDILSKPGIHIHTDALVVLILYGIRMLTWMEIVIKQYDV